MLRPLHSMSQLSACPYMGLAGMQLLTAGVPTAVNCPVSWAANRFFFLNTSLCDRSGFLNSVAKKESVTYVSGAWVSSKHHKYSGD